MGKFQTSATRTLHDAVRDENFEETKLLIVQGADVNAKDKHSRAPIHLAAWKGNPDMILLLLSFNASAKSTAMDLFTPLHFAAQGTSVACIEELIKHDKSLLNAQSSKGNRTALHLAAVKGNVSILSKLIELGADTSIKTATGQTAADLAKLPAAQALLRCEPLPTTESTIPILEKDQCTEHNKREQASSESLEIKETAKKSKRTKVSHDVN